MYADPCHCAQYTPKDPVAQSVAQVSLMFEKHQIAAPVSDIEKYCRGMLDYFQGSWRGGTVSAVSSSVQIETIATLIT